MLTVEDLNELGHSIIDEAEKVLGRRLDLPFYGFKFWEERPECCSFLNGYIIFIKDKSDFHQLRFQIAHEVIHLLSPTSRENVSVFEEGLATKFSLCYMERLGETEYVSKSIDHLRDNWPSYYKGLTQVNQIDSLFETVKRIREHYPHSTFSDLTAEDLKLFISDSNLREQLTRKFNN